MRLDVVDGATRGREFHYLGCAWDGNGRAAAFVCLFVCWYDIFGLFCFFCFYHFSFFYPNYLVWYVRTVLVVREDTNIMDSFVSSRGLLAGTLCL